MPLHQLRHHIHTYSSALFYGLPPWPPLLMRARRHTRGWCHAPGPYAAALTSELAFKKTRTVGLVVFTSPSSELVILPPPSDAHSLTPTGPVDDTARPYSLRCGLPDVRSTVGRRAQQGRHGLPSKAVAPDGSPPGRRTARLEFVDVTMPYI